VANNFPQQQEKFDRFIERYNHRRPRHRRHMCGRVCFGSRRTNLGTMLDGHNAASKEVDDEVWLSSFIQGPRVLRPQGQSLRVRDEPVRCCAAGAETSGAARCTQSSAPDRQTN
jgi:hypothetical protein